MTSSFPPDRMAQSWAVRGLKMIVLIIPWLFVAHGISVLRNNLVFFNNSVPALAKVVALPARQDPLENAADIVVAFTPEILKAPSFLYQHENGLTFVGGPVVTPYFWQYHQGEAVEVRYNRLRPDQAQPVSVTRFWWPPILFIGGGLFAFLSLAFSMRPATMRPVRRRRKANGALKLRRD